MITDSWSGILGYRQVRLHLNRCLIGDDRKRPAISNARNSFRWKRVSVPQATEDQTMAKELKSTQSEVKRAMHKRKEGTLKSGRSGKTGKSEKQAIAIGLSEARAKGEKVPVKKAS